MCVSSAAPRVRFGRWQDGRALLRFLFALHFDLGQQHSRGHRGHRNPTGFGAAKAVEHFRIVVGGHDLAEGDQRRADQIQPAYQFLSAPSYVAAIVLVTAFAVDEQWFPVFGNGSGVGGTVHHLTLPAIALALSWTAFVAQLTKAAVVVELDSEHVDTARSRGLRESVVIRRHVVRNAMIPITTVAGLTVAGLVAGDVVVEHAFGLGGIGSFLVQAASQKDFAVVQALSLLMVAIFVRGQHWSGHHQRAARSPHP